MSTLASIEAIFGRRGTARARAAGFESRAGPGADGEARRARFSRERAHDRRSRNRRREIAGVPRPGAAQREESRRLDRDDRAARAAGAEGHSARARRARRRRRASSCSRAAITTCAARSSTHARGAARRPERYDGTNVGVGRRTRRPATAPSCRSRRRPTNGNSSTPTPTTASASSASAFATASSSRAATRRKFADLVVVNHALFFLDLAMGGTLLPPYDFAILDEAHQCER